MNMIPSLTNEKVNGIDSDLSKLSADYDKLNKDLQRVIGYLKAREK